MPLLLLLPLSPGVRIAPADVTGGQDGSVSFSQSCLLRSNMDGFIECEPPSEFEVRMRAGHHLARVNLPIIICSFH